MGYGPIARIHRTAGLAGEPFCSLHPLKKLLSARFLPCIIGRDSHALPIHIYNAMHLCGYADHADACVLFQQPVQLLPCHRHDPVCILPECPFQKPVRGADALLYPAALLVIQDQTDRGRSYIYSNSFHDVSSPMRSP